MMPMKRLRTPTTRNLVSKLIQNQIHILQHSQIHSGRLHYSILSSPQTHAIDSPQSMTYHLLYEVSLLLFLSFISIFLQEGTWNAPNSILVLHNGNGSMGEALCHPPRRIVIKPTPCISHQSINATRKETTPLPSNRVMNQTKPIQPVKQAVTTSVQNRRAFHSFPWNDGFGGAFYPPFML